MTETNQKILNLIIKDKTLRQISQDLNLSRKQVYYRIVSMENSGFSFKPKYYCNGDISFKLRKNVKSNEKNSIDIITPIGSKHFEAIFVSDLHIGSEKERLDLMKQVDDFCLKNNINLIFITGDVMDGFSYQTIRKHSTYEEQIEYAIKNYPYNENIINFACLGNHDIDSLLRNGQDLSTILKKRRYDIVPIGYAECVVNIKNEQIVLQHNINGFKNSERKNQLIFRGHTHRSKYIKDENNNHIIYLPTLSDILYDETYFKTGCKFLPTVFHLDIHFKNGYFDSVKLRQLLLGDCIHEVNEINLDILREKSKINSVIKYEEDFPIYSFDEQNQKVKEYKCKSQIDKFNDRYRKD